MSDRPTFVEQLHRNMVAVISLCVALSSLGYNTWRNEQTEHNRNIRTAGFEVLSTIGELQQVVFFSHYDMDPTLGNPRRGWAQILTLHDLSQVMPAPVPAAAAKLRATWNAHWENLHVSEADLKAIDAGIDAYRAVVLDTLRQLR